uniref:DDE Tnp4 domain-containing protein n=1 Tax=Strigamia maritima TaxID=126957 RepID=T1J696_STRMM
MAHCTTRVITAITPLSSRFIKWPTAAERLEISAEMGKKGVPNCIGFIDGSHLRLVSEPVEDGISYFNRKSFYSLNMTAIVNYKKAIIGFQLGFPGKVHDMTVFKSMSIYKNPQLHFRDNDI